MRNNIHAHEESHLSVRLEREAEDDDSETQLASEMLDAVEALAAGWLEPLALHLSVGCYDTEAFYAPEDSAPPQPQWFLRKDTLPAGISADPVYVEPVTTMVPDLGIQEIRAWVARAMSQRCPDAPRFIPSWRELYWTALRVRLPDSRAMLDGHALHVDCYAGNVAVAVEPRENTLWISGPLEQYSFGPPVTVIARNYDGVIAVGLDIYWSLWLDDPSGRAQVDAAVDRVLDLDRGWQRSND